MVYRFKVTYEDHDDVYRYIDIKSSQSFLELHNAIQQSIGFDNSKSATFYSSDDYWRKEKEISMENTNDKQSPKVKTKKTESDKKKTIANYIDNPHQRFVYVFDPEKEWTFQLELLKIVPEEKDAIYPRCIKTVGNSPKQYKPAATPAPVEEDDLDNPPAKGRTAKNPEKEEHDGVILERDPIEDETKDFIPLNEDVAEEELTEEEENETSENEDADIDDSSSEEDGEVSGRYDLDDDI